ncbi:DUF2059 domain-containing protein [Chamaesiphon minutus]|uniref:Uncharacterized protein n=1 Tax=Chamaesiphon minutus (strain ATCC 27169 / PCC 6605) TaxID=1173020 RepID=K9UME3_CHAP6|nr:DUF2059 domain-containing protein [Chamaesiphon minutus]AFY96000.1 hypothetical protein Cha6605_5100 [Chamaesiphon minutus PCC 6605]
MLKIRIGALSLLICSTAMISWVANARIESTQVVAPKKVALDNSSKRALVKELMTKIGIDRKYDLYVGGNADLSLPVGAKPKFRQWMQKLIASEAGWKKIEDRYLARFEANFSENELRELLQLAKQPAMQKLVRTEIQAYIDTAETRQKFLSQLWDEYNSGKFTPPAEITR